MKTILGKTIRCFQFYKMDISKGQRKEVSTRGFIWFEDGTSIRVEGSKFFIYLWDRKKVGFISNKMKAYKQIKRMIARKFQTYRKHGTFNHGIDTIYNNAITKIEKMTFETLESVKVDFEQNIYKTETAGFEEFELDFNDKLNIVKSQFTAKEKQLSELEAQRIEAEKLKIEREKLEADRKALEEKQAAENARIAKEKADAEAKLEADKKAIEDQQKAAQEKLEADRSKIENEQKEAQQKLDAEREKLESEKAKIAQAEADKKAKELAEAVAIEKAENDLKVAEKAKEDAEIKAKKQEALKPEKEKAVDFLNALVFKNDLPEITDSEIINHLQTFMAEIEQQRNDLIKFIQTL